ncbi:antitoxin VapB family protein [Halorutilales archaeon Cl-col2-1]
MVTATEQIRVSDEVKRHLEQRKREGESFNEVIERILLEDSEADFYEGFGRWSDEHADAVREGLQNSRGERKRRLKQPSASSLSE